MKFNNCMYVFLFYSFIFGCATATISYEFEKVIGGAGQPRSPWRSMASENGTLDVYKGDKIQLKLCVDNDMIMSIDNIAYSNDGESDTVRVLVWKTAIGTLKSVATYDGYGKHWNEFKASGKIGSSFALPKGDHFMYLDIESTDCYGIELDKMDISTDMPVQIDSLICGAKLILAEVPTSCSAPLDAPIYPTQSSERTTKPQDTAAKSTTPEVITTTVASTTASERPAFVQQLSYPYGCLDTQNVKVKFNPTSLTNVSIYARATKPNKLFERPKTKLTKSKGLCDKSIWQIGVIDNDNSELGPPSMIANVVHDIASQTDDQFPSSIDPSVTKEIHLRYVVPSDINIKRGAVYLTLGLVNVTSATRVGLRYFGRARSNPSDVTYKSFTPGQRVVTWTLPARSVSPLLENQLHIYFDADAAGKMNIDFLRLDYTASDLTLKSKPVFQSPLYKVRGHQYKTLKNIKTPEGMNLTVNGKRIDGNYAKVVLLAKPQKRGKFLKLLTITSEGNIIPFHANKKSMKANRPIGVTFADISGIGFGAEAKKISNVAIDTKKEEIKVTFSDGTYVKFTFNYSKQRTKLKIIESSLTDNSVLFKSTHVGNYMSAVNKVVIDNKAEKHIMDDLDNVKGERFSFIKTSQNPMYKTPEKLELHFPANSIPNK